MPASVLVVEDNLTLRWLFVQQLEKLGLQSDCAANGNEGVRQFKKRRHYQLVLMDVMMPEIDGYEATKQIREFELLEKLRHASIVAITCVEDADICRAAGMDDYYQKPILPQHLKQIIEKWLPKEQKCRPQNDVIAISLWHPRELKMISSARLFTTALFSIYEVRL